MTLRDELRTKFPGLAKAGPRSRAKLFCIECMGGNLNDSRACTELDCFLWPLWLARVADDRDRATAIAKVPDPGGSGARK